MLLFTKIYYYATSATTGRWNQFSCRIETEVSSIFRANTPKPIESNRVEHPKTARDMGDVQS